MASVLIESLKQAAQLPVSNPDRAIQIMAVLTRAFKANDYSVPILVGGGAVEYYTNGFYTTVDVDALLYSQHPKVNEVMRGLGFEKRGKDWVHGTIPDLYVEFPGTPGDPPWVVANTVDVDGIPVQIISLESLIIEKVCAYSVASPIDGVNAMALIAAGDDDLDWDFIRENAGQEGVLPLLDGLLNLIEDIDWGSPPSHEALQHLLMGLRPGSPSSTVLTQRKAGEDNESNT